MAQDCLFCRIVSGAAPADIVFEDEWSLAFLDSRPLFPGHTLLIPKQHVETLPELPPELTGSFFRRVQLLCLAVQQGMDAVGTHVAVNNRVSQSVPHLHVHIVPRRPKDGLRGFFWPRQKYADLNAARQAAEAVRKALAGLPGA